MFCAENEDDSPKTPIVHPNDILDIEVSPISRSFNLLPPPVYDFIPTGRPEWIPPKPTCTPSKQKLKKLSGVNSSNGASKRQIPASMRRGDPFLPSVFSDENPIVDLTVKKNSRKKPSDCKCKGFGYNLSPSALLPEEMRQQWGVGVFGKHSAIKPNSTHASNTSSSQLYSTPSHLDREMTRCPISAMPRLASICINNSISGTIGSSSIYNSSNINSGIINASINNNSEVGTGIYCSMRCMRCMREPCICVDFGQIHEGFRIPDQSDKKKPKPASKSLISKGKDSKVGSCGLIGNTITTTPVKRTACYSSKDNSNIISTSHFQRNSSSPVNMSHTGMMYSSEPIGINSALARSTSASKLSHSGAESHSIAGNKSNSFLQGDHPNINRQSLQPRRVIASISPAPIISSGILDTSATPPNFQTAKKPSTISRITTPARRVSTQDCACDSCTCRRRSHTMTTMEALGLSANDANQQIIPPYLLPPRPQKYSQPRVQTLPSSSRYNPYRLPAYSYKSSLRDVYGSPESYTRTSSPMFDFSDAPSLGNPAYTSTPLSEIHDFNRLDTSALYLDSDSASLSPPLSMHSGVAWMVDDITDLSIKETVEFFVSLKPPIAASVPSPLSDTSSDMFTPSPGEPRCPSPGLTPASGSCFCIGSNSIGNWVSQSASEKYGRDNIGIYNESTVANTKLPIQSSSADGKSGFYQSTPMLYSSLVSDLEDELRCAIENIPT